jgi:hypothetical protein
MSALDLTARMLTSAWTAPTAGRSLCPDPNWRAAVRQSGTGWEVAHARRAAPRPGRRAQPGLPTRQ